MSAGDIIKIGSGSKTETRKIINLASPAETDVAAPGFGGRPGGPSGSTVIWQPLPEGPVITIPKNATAVPVVSVNGFKVGQKMAIGYGATYPAVAQGIEKYEIVTITSVGKPGTQAYLAVEAKAGTTNIKVSSVANISVGDKIRLDIDSKGHGIETVTVTKVGTPSSRGPGRGPFAANEDVGTGLDLEQPLKYDHSANIPFSVNGTGIGFEPATSFPHSSNEPVLALGSSLTLDRPLANDQDINGVVLDERVKSAGYQEEKKPDQWFGGPELAGSAGSMNLRDATGNVVDALNYGGVVDPWLAEGYQAVSGTGKNGNYVPSPGTGRGFRPELAAGHPNRSAGRYPDGADNDDNGNDFLLQNSISFAIASAAGDTNIKVSSMTSFNVGQECIIGSGANSETATVAAIGTAGGTTLDTITNSGATIIPVVSVAGFEPGQTITIGSGPEREIATIATVTFPRRGGNRTNAQSESVTVSAPLKYGHAVGEQVSGTGITFTKGLAKAHGSGTQIASDLPTPGAPNRYIKKR